MIDDIGYNESDWDGEIIANLIEQNSNMRDALRRMQATLETSDDHLDKVEREARIEHDRLVRAETCLDDIDEIVHDFHGQTNLGWKTIVGLIEKQLDIWHDGYIPRRAEVEE